MPTATNRERLINLISLTATVSLLGVLLIRYDKTQIVRSLAGARLSWLFIAGAILVVSHLVGVTDRWRHVVRLAGVRLSFSEAWLMRMGGAPLKFFTPLRAGELLRLPYLGRRHGMQTDHALSVLVFDKLTILLGLAPALIVRALVFEELGSALSTIGVALLVAAFVLPQGRGILLKLLSPFGERVQKISSGLMIAFANAGTGRTIFLIGYAALIMLAEVLVQAFCLYAVDVQIDPLLWWTVLPAVLFAAMVPITTAGVGAREAALVLLFPAEDPARLIAAGILFFLLARLGIALVGLPWTPRYLKRILAAKKENS